MREKILKTDKGSEYGKVFKLIKISHRFMPELERNWKNDKSGFVPLIEFKCILRLRRSLSQEIKIIGKTYQILLPR